MSVIAQGGARIDLHPDVQAAKQAGKCRFIGFTGHADPEAHAAWVRSLSPTKCLKCALSQPGVHVAICGAGTLGQMGDTIRTVQDFRKLTPEEMADVRKRAVVGAEAYTGPTMEYWNTMEYWKKKT